MQINPLSEQITDKLTQSLLIFDVHATRSFGKSSQNFFYTLHLKEVPSYYTSQGGSCGRILRFTFGSRHLHRSRKNKEPVKIANSSIINGGTGTIYIFMAEFALLNAYLWLCWPFLMKGYEHTFSPYGGTHNKAPKRKNVAPLAL